MTTTREITPRPLINNQFYGWFVLAVLISQKIPLYFWHAPPQLSSANHTGNILAFAIFMLFSLFMHHFGREPVQADYAREDAKLNKAQRWYLAYIACLWLLILVLVLTPLPGTVYWQAVLGALPVMLIAARYHTLWAHLVKRYNIHTELESQRLGWVIAGYYVVTILVLPLALLQFGWISAFIHVMLIALGLPPALLALSIQLKIFISLGKAGGRLHCA